MTVGGVRSAPLTAPAGATIERASAATAVMTTRRRASGSAAASPPAWASAVPVRGAPAMGRADQPAASVRASPATHRRRTLGSSHDRPLLRCARRERFVGQHARPRRGAQAPRDRGDRDRPARSRPPRTSSRPSGRSSPTRRRPASRRSPSAASPTAAGSPRSPRPADGTEYAGIVCFSYPLHAPGKPEQAEARSSHWPAIRCPVLLLSGEADPFARIELLRAAVPLLRDGELHTYPRLGHTLKPVLEDALDRAATFLVSLRAEHGSGRAGQATYADGPQAPRRQEAFARQNRRRPSRRAQPGDCAHRSVPPIALRPCVPHRSACSPRRPGRKEHHCQTWLAAVERSSSRLHVATIILSVIPFAATLGRRALGTNRFLYALGQVESGGKYNARNSYSGAYGKYQIMPSNWPGWAKQYIGNSTAP